MLEPSTTEFKGPPVKSTIFKDWSPYSSRKIMRQLPENIKYTAPKVNKELRQRIGEQENQINGDNKMILGICLSYLEQGMLVDNFDEENVKRNEFLLSHRIKVGNEEINLSELDRRMNKLSGSSINQILLAGDLVYNPDIKNRSRVLYDKIAAKKYFEPKDLLPIDDLARDIIEHILR